MDEDPWKRLGRLLTERRVELGYPKRLTWARDVLKINHDRVLADIEGGKRTNYERSTIAQVERYYQWEGGSVQRVLDGGDPIPRRDLMSNAIYNSEHDRKVRAGIIEPDAAQVVFDRWFKMNSMLQGVVFEYAAARGIDTDSAHDELAETLAMYYESQNGPRPWTPPWEDWTEEFGPGARPWEREWWTQRENEQLLRGEEEIRQGMIANLESEARALGITVGRYGEEFGFDFDEAAAALGVEVQRPEGSGAAQASGVFGAGRHRDAWRQMEDVAARREDTAG